MSSVLALAHSFYFPLAKWVKKCYNISIILNREMLMKRFLILLVMLCLLVSTVFVISCGGNTDTDTSTDTTSDTDTSVDTSTDTDNTPAETTYVIILKDQEGDAIANSSISILDRNDNEVKSVTTDSEGKVTVSVSGECYADVTSLPEGFLDVAGLTKLEGEEVVIVVQNNIPNGTMGRPYPVEDENVITLEPNGSVYYICYGGGRNFLVENAQGLKVTYGTDEPREADDDNQILFKMPTTDSNNRAVRVFFENTTSETKTYTLKIYSDKGALDNPYDLVLGENTKATVEKDTTVYYKWVADKDAMVIAYSETPLNSIYFYNTTKSIVSNSTAGSNSTYIYANAGDEIMVYVSSNATNNYNKVEFTVTAYGATEEDPIPLYNNTKSFMLDKAQSLTYSVTVDVQSTLTIEGANVVVTVGEEEYDLSDDGYVDLFLDEGETVVFKVTSTNESGREDIRISCYELEQSEY